MRVCQFYIPRMVNERFSEHSLQRNALIPSPTNTANDYEKGFYSTNTYTEELIRYLDERTPEQRSKPFFAALTYAAPHWPLQCSKSDREKYKGFYDDGPNGLRDRRLAKLRELGIVEEGVIPHEVYHQLPMSNESREKYVQWEEMNAEQRVKSARAMETYAGMVDVIDRNVGKIVDYLETIGEKDSK